MEFDIHKLGSLIEGISSYEDIELSDIPNLDLYMDQVITLFDSKLSHLRRNEEDKILTKTMINNYTKAKILMPSTKKKYSKDHIILLILIYYLKQNLSISDISLLFKDMIKTVESTKNESLEIEKIYQSFLHVKKADSSTLQEDLNKKVNLVLQNTKNLPPENLEFSQMLITVLTLINEANTYKRLSEKIIDNFFTNYEFK
ncbi:DUF1836 domain-containing protein [Clostridium sp. HMP27]|uniref:DUF1836 domain-containing protein n=1 Tax=Clostridium sp. HMP27 TaxID=1487921 RepID=UPI00052CE1BD|nr:DUF1836 domain-containing protein [Clostridium sp. HMP27]KGK86080.1 hypothetical protein DP68_14765 [Clostridium sp. HMP27]